MNRKIDGAQTPNWDVLIVPPFWFASLVSAGSWSTMDRKEVTIEITHCSGFSGHQDSERYNCALGVQNSSDTVENFTLNQQFTKKNIQKQELLDVGWEGSTGQ